MHILELAMMNTGSVLELPVYWGEVSYKYLISFLDLFMHITTSALMNQENELKRKIN